MIAHILHGGYSCQQVAEHASAFIEGEMSLRSWLAYRVHLLSCPPCAEYVRQIGLTVDALRTLPGSDGAELRGQVLDAFDAWQAEQRPSAE